MKGSHSSIRYFGIGLVLFFSLACGFVSSIAPATEVPPTSTISNTPLPTATAAPTLTPTQVPVPYSIFKELKTFQGSTDGIASMVFSPDGKLLAYGDYGNNSITLVDITTGETIKTIEGHTKPVSALAFSPDGQLLASTGTVNLPPGEDGSVRLWDVQTGKQLAIFQTAGISQLEFSPDGALLAGATGGKTLNIFLWDIQARSQKKSFSDVFSFGNFSPDGSLIATGGRDNLIHILEVQTGNEVMSLSGHGDLISAAAYSADGKLFASGGWDRTIYLWDTVTGKSIKSLEGHEGEVSWVKFNPAGTILASLGNGFQITREGGQFNLTFIEADKFLRFWDIETGQQIGKFEITDGIANVAFNTDWTLIATGNATGLIQIWEVGP